LARIRNPNRDKAFELYKENNGKISPKEISDVIGEKVENVYSWKSIDKWDSKLEKKPGAPKGNLNAIGKVGGPPKGNTNAKKEKKPGAPKGNLNNLQEGNYYDHTKHMKKDFLRKYLPAATTKIIKEVSKHGMTSLEILWENIQLQLASIMISPKIMEVTSKGEMIKELKKSKVQSETQTDNKTGKKKKVEVYREEEYEFQFAWDRQATFLNSQSRAMSELRSLIKQYDDMLHKDWDLVSEEQKYRVKKLKLEVLGIEKEYKDKELAGNKINPYAGLSSEELRKLINNG